MKYQSGLDIFLGDRVTYNGQMGCIALIGNEDGSGSAAIQWSEWVMNDEQLLILFDNGARLILDNLQQDEFLVFSRRRE